MDLKHKMPNILFIALLILIMGILSAPIHELGHALVYKAFGYDISFNLTSVTLISGEETLISAAAGIIANILLSLLFLVLFYKTDNIYFFALSASSISFRIILYILGFLVHAAPYDETFISKILNIDIKSTMLIIFVIMLLILFSLLKKLYTGINKNQADKILCVLAVSSIIGFIILVLLENKGL